jgi:transcription initiation factor TFIID subunit 7
MAANTPTGGAPKLKLKFGGGSSSISSVPAPAGSPPADSTAKPAKRKYNRKPKPETETESPLKSPISSKKRARKDEEDQTENVGPKKVAKGSGGLKLRIGSSIKPPPQEISGEQLIKLNTNAANGASLKRKNQAERLKVKLRTPSQIVRLVNNKAASQLPPREPGAGYDSEAESVEDDPAIEQQFVIRMLPGEDCDYLREAIETRKLGVSLANGGADVRLRFLQRDGRRAMLSIRGNHYVAFLVDLPCIVESMKSWDRKNFYKSADIHQMLLVTQSVKDEAEARSAELPYDIGIDPGTWSYPHGLTPPMHWVRKRRFRKRINHRTIEQVEEEVERLLELDEQCARGGGSSMYTIFDPHANDEDDELDADGEDEMGDMFQTIEAMDGADDLMGEGMDEDDDLAKLMAAELGREDDEEDGLQDHGQNITGRVLASPEAMTQDNFTSVDATGTQTQATTAAPSASPQARDEDEDDSDDQDEDDEDDELDDEEKAAQQEKQQQREEIEEIENEVAELDRRIAGFSNPMLALKFKEKRDKLVRDLKLKKKNLGEDDESDED